MANSSVPAALSKEDLDRLRFKPAAPISNDPPPAGAKTRILGYFNPNPWPVHIVHNATGLSLTLNNRGEFLVRGNRKINDPVLEQFVGANQLSREMSPTEVEYVLLPSRDRVAAPPTGYGFSGTQEVKHNAAGQPVMPRGAVAAPTPKASASPIMGMSIEQARKMKLIRQPTLVDIDAGIEDREGSIVDASHAPTLEVPVDRPPRRSVVPDAPAQDLNQPETAKQAEIIRSVQEAQNYDPTDIKGIMHSAAATVPGGLDALRPPDLGDDEVGVGVPESVPAPVPVTPAVVVKAAKSAAKKRARRSLL